MRTLGDIDPRDIDEQRVVAYIARRRRDGIRGQTIRREMAALKRGLSWAHRRGYIRQPIAAWPVVKSDPVDARYAGKLISNDDMARLMAELPGHVRDWMTFAALTGLRKAELARARFDWCDQARLFWANHENEPARELVRKLFRCRS